MRSHGSHEDFGRQEPPPTPTSTRGFAWLLAFVFAVVGGWLLFKARGEGLTGWSLLGLALFVLAADVWLPVLLKPLNWLWHRLGLLLGHIVTPLVLGLIFFSVVTPIGLLRRLLGRRSLTRVDSAAATYWKRREPPGPEPEQLKQQF
ncbi:MAG: SxtJ family membrane protein [Pseudomonadota bacterium]